MITIPGVQLIDREAFIDVRGRFVEVFRASELPEQFVQANHSKSVKGVLRGLHYHRHQSDLWYLVSGKVQVVLADLRVRGGVPEVANFELDGDNPVALYIPPGVAHGFAALTDVDLLYWVTTEYDPADEHGIAWDDPTLDVPWKVTDPHLSDRDVSNPPFLWDDIPTYEDKGDPLKVPYAPVRHQAFGEEEIRAVVDALRDGWLGVGPKVGEFESAIAEHFGKTYGVMVNSGSSANILAAEEIPEGARIATPALTFTTTLAYLIGKDIELVDVEEATYQIDFSKIEQEPDVLFVPNLLGNIPDWSTAPPARIFEDSCDTITDAGKGLSDIATTSFYASHIITACGGGGMLLTDDLGIAERARSKRAWGRPTVDESDMDGRLGDVDGVIYDKRFTYDWLGYNFQPIELEAAFGLVQLEKLDNFIQIRNAHFDRLHAFFQRYEDRFILPITRPGANWLAFPVTIREGIDRTDMVRHLEAKGVQTRPIFSGNITRQPAYAKILGKQPFPVADKVMRDGLLLGAHHGLKESHLDYLEETLAAYLEGARS